MVVEYNADEIGNYNSSQEVEVTLSYEGNTLTFPINPENLKQVVDSNSTTEDIENIGQISIPQRPSLSVLSFSSFFWADRDTISPRKRVEWIKNWQKSRKPARLSVTSIDWDMDVTCESFSYWVNAGEEKDIYFTLSLMEYRAYGAKQVKLVGNQYILDENGVQTVIGTVPTLQLPFNFSESAVQVPYLSSSPRSTINKREVPAQVMVGEDESVESILQRYGSYTSSWKDVYIENGPEIAEAVSDSVEAYSSAKEFTDYSSWVKNNWKTSMNKLKGILDKFFIYGPPVNI